MGTYMNKTGTSVERPDDLATNRDDSTDEVVGR